MGTRQLFSLAVLLGVWLLAHTEAAYKRDYGHPRSKKPAAEIGRSTRASYPNRQPEISALYSAPKPQKLQQEQDQSANDVEFNEQQSTTTEIPFDEDQLVIDAADDGAEIIEHEDDEGTSEDYQQQGAATDKPAALQEDPSFNEFPTSPSSEDGSSYFRRKPVPNSYERSHVNSNSFRQPELQEEAKSAREEAPSQYLPPVISVAPQRSPQITQNEYNAPRSGYSNPSSQNQNSHNQQRRLPDQQQIETKPFQNHVQVQIASPNGNEENVQGNQIETNIPARQYLPEFETVSQEGNNGYNNYGAPPHAQQQPQQQQHQPQPSPIRFSAPASQNEIPNYSSAKKEESEPLQLEGLSESIVDAELLQRVQQIIEEHEKQQKEYLEKQFREHDNAFSQTNRQSTTGGYNNNENNNGRVPLQLQAQQSPSSSSYFRDANPSTSSPPANSPQQQHFETRSSVSEGSFEQEDYYQRQSHSQSQRNYPEPRQPQQFPTAAPNGNLFGDFRVQPEQIEPIAPTSRHFHFGGGYADSGEGQGRGEQQQRYPSPPVFRDVGNSIFSQDEGGYGGEVRDQETRTSKLNNYGIGGEGPEGKSQPLKAEPEIEYQKAVLSTHFTETQPDPAFQTQQPNSREYLPPAPQAPLHQNSQFSSPAQLGTPAAETRASVQPENQKGNPGEQNQGQGFQFYQTEIPFQQPQASFPTHNQNQNHFKNSQETEFASVNVNAGLIVSSQGQDVHSSAGDVVYGVPSSNLDPSRNAHSQASTYPGVARNAGGENFFRPQQIPAGNGEPSSHSQYLPPFQAQFRPETEQLEQTNPFASHPSTNNNNNDPALISKSQEFSHQNAEGVRNTNHFSSPDNSQTDSAYGFPQQQHQQQQIPYYQQQQQQQQQPTQQQPQPFFQQGRPGASFFNNNQAEVISAENGNSNGLAEKSNEVQEGQGQSESVPLPRPLYGIPLAPVISIDSGEEFRGLETDFPSVAPSSFFHDGESRESAAGFPAFPTTQSINNNYLGPQAAVETPFNPFPQQPQQQLFQQSHSPALYALPAQLEQVNTAEANNNNRNDERNGYGNAPNDNSAHLDQIPLVSNIVSVPTRDYSPPTSYSYSNRLPAPVTSSSTNPYGRIRKRLAPSSTPSQST